jgi:NADH:ubiquinone oxidoreductase subunit D
MTSILIFIACLVSLVIGIQVGHEMAGDQVKSASEILHQVNTRIEKMKEIEGDLEGIIDDQVTSRLDEVKGMFFRGGAMWMVDCMLHEDDPRYATAIKMINEETIE